MSPRQSDPICEICGGTNIVKHLPKEINRKLDHEKITVHAESGSKKMTVAMLRVTY